MPRLATILRRQKTGLHKGYLKVTDEHKIPLFVVRGRRPGKIAFISGGIHGDELNGIRLVQMLLHSIKPKKIWGTLIIIPVLNISGFHETKREAADGKDLNRSFPGKGKSISALIAKKFFKEIVSISDFGIDCHDSGQKLVLLPHPRVHVDESGRCAHGCTEELGKLLGTKIILKRPGKEGMMAIEAYKRLHKPILTVEVGGALILWDRYLNEAMRGIHNILIHYGMMDGIIRMPRKQYIIEHKERFRYRAKFDGLLYKHVQLGQSVHKKTHLATIHNPLTEKTVKVHSNRCGFVFSLRHQDKIIKGKTILSVLQDEDCKRCKTKAHKGVESLQREKH